MSNLIANLAAELKNFQRFSFTTPIHSSNGMEFYYAPGTTGGRYGSNVITTEHLIYSPNGVKLEVVVTVEGEDYVEAISECIERLSRR